MSTRKRSGSGSKRPKEKVVYIYELLLRGEDPRVSNNNSEFWNEFFLLQPNLDWLDNELTKLTVEQLVQIKHNVDLLFSQCVDMLSSDNPKRLCNCLQTLCAIFHAFFKKQNSEIGCDIINEILDFDKVEEKIKRLISECNKLLISKGNVEETPRLLCLKLLLILITGRDNLEQNILLEYIIGNTIFDTFVLLLSDPMLRGLYGHDVVILLTLLVNYRKYETANPYIVQLSILADELALNGYGQMISSSLVDFSRQYTQNLPEMQSSSWFSLSWMGNFFVSDEGCERVQQIRANNVLLLALYEAVHLNRNFITTLAHTQAESSAPPSPTNTLNANQSAPDPNNPPPIIDVTQYPTNLLVAVFQYCSIVMQDHKNESSTSNLKLCFIILTCIAEDQYANSMMHDSNLTFKVMLHRVHMRHRKLPTDRISKSQPLAATLLDLLVEFVVSHLMKKFPMELYALSIGVIHRILCYQKRYRVRLNYPWKELWAALIGLLKFLVYQEQNLVKKFNIFQMGIKVINIFNLFITYGDTFLATTNSYDELYYELNREEKVFSELHAMVLRYTTMGDCEYKEDVLKLLNSLVNILAIIKHFQNKIKEWLSSQGLSTPTEQQILDVVRKNYDLTLKLQDSLDHYERYAESPKHAGFFSKMVRDVVNTTRKTVFASIKEIHNVPQDLLVN